MTSGCFCAKSDHMCTAVKKERSLCFSITFDPLQLLHCLFQNRILRDSQRAPFNIKALKQSNQATDYFNYNRCTHLFPQKNGKNAKEILKNVEHEIYKILKSPLSPLSFQK